MQKLHPSAVTLEERIDPYEVLCRICTHYRWQAIYIAAAIHPLRDNFLLGSTSIVFFRNLLVPSE